MPEFPAQRLAEWTGGQWTMIPQSPMMGFCVDSRQLRRGQVFVAIKTDKRDGHDYVGAAAAAGAAAAIVATPILTTDLPQLVVRDPLAAFQAIAREHRRAFQGRVVGISGSAGKTSTKDLLALLLGGDTCGVPATGELASGKGTGSSRAPGFTGRVLATEGNLNNHLGVPLTLTRLDSDAHDFAVVEAGISAPGEMRALADMIEPDVAVITLIAPAHTEELGGIEGVAREKAQLPAAVRKDGVAIFSRETADFAPFRQIGARSLIVERATEPRFDTVLSDTVRFTLAQREDQTSIVLGYAGSPQAFTFRRVTDGMAHNAALAICAALWLGVPATLVQSRLGSWRPAKMRGEIRRDRGRLLYLDCYNANPASMADALATFDAIVPATEPRLYVIGSMEELGAESAAYHRALGRSLELRSGDHVYLIGTYAADVREGAVEAGDVAPQVHVAASTDEIAEALADWRGAIFVKGSRRYQLEKVLGPAEDASHGSSAGGGGATPGAGCSTTVTPGNSRSDSGKTEVRASGHGFEATGQRESDAIGAPRPIAVAATAVPSSRSGPSARPQVAFPLAKAPTATSSGPTMPATAPRFTTLIHFG